MLKQHIELVGKVIKPKEIQTTKGWIYSFSIPITEMDGENQLTQWLNCSIFLKERDTRITQHTGEFHIVGKLVVKKAWGNNPQSLGLFGFEITPVLGKVYKVSKPKHEDQAQAPKQEQNVPTQQPNGQRVQQPQAQQPPQPQQQPETYEAYKDPIAAITMPEDEIPF